MKINPFLLLVSLFLFMLMPEILFAQSENPFSAKKKTQQNTLPVTSPTGTIDSKNAQPISAKALPQTPASVAPFGQLSLPPVLSPRTQTLHEMEIFRDGTNGLPVFIESTNPVSARASRSSSIEIEKASLDYLEEIKSVLPIKTPKDEFEVKSISEDAGLTHVKLQQTFEGIPVYGSEVMVHFVSADKVLFNGRYEPTPTLGDVIPEITAAAAELVALQDVSAKTNVVALTPEQETLLKYYGPESELVVYRTPGYIRSQRLAWHLTLRPNFIRRYEYFIDAKTGAILHSYDHTCAIGPVTGTANDLGGVGRTVHSFEYATNNFVLLNMSKPMYHGSNNNPQNGDGYILTADFNNTSTQNPSYNEITSANKNSWNATAVSAHYNAGVAYDYFQNTFGRISINGDSGDIVSFINVQDENGPMDNAFWNGAAMFYGNGNQAFTPLAKSLDVGGHEMTHGVVQGTANLEYQDQSGALNESFADVFGVMIDRDDWTLGETVVKPAAFPSGAMRNMANPHNGGSGLGSNGWQPSHMNELYTGSQDNGGVHINSGIPNHAFYLIATAIGKEKAEQIYYKTLRDWLTRSSQFVDLRVGVLNAANTVAGVTAADKTAISNAFDQVGIPGPGGSGGSGGGTNGQNYQYQLPINPGPDFIVSTDVNFSDPVELYISSTTGTNFQALSNTTPLSKISVTDDGSEGYFVGDDHHIYGLFMNAANPQEIKLSNSAEWDNVAISKDGTRLAAISNSVDTSVYVFNLAANPITGVKYRLYNPTTAQGINTGDVLYADAIEWDYSGEYIMYDAFNEITNISGTNLEYWDVGFLRAWNNATNNYGDGTVTKLFSSLQEGESVGNAVFSKNSAAVIAFDYFTTSTSENYLLGANIETGDLGTIYQNDMLSYPSYSKADDKVIFNAQTTGGDEVVAVIGLATTKITSTGSATGLIGDAKWGVWYAKGSRNINIAIEDELPIEGDIRLYPNPLSENLFVEFDLKNTANVRLELRDVSGKMINATPNRLFSAGVFSSSIPVSSLSAGVYFMRIWVDDAAKTIKVVKTE
ncbi:MAG: M4 family metallopeptidase [Bacteroidia bacterium]|nr:M4 family metallopeptidase [Bacteroidia bacterium]